MTRDLVLGRYLCEMPACKVPKNADGNYYSHASAEDYLLGSRVPRAVPEAGGTKDGGAEEARAVEGAGSTTTRGKIPGCCPCHHGRAVGAAAVSGYVYV